MDFARAKYCGLADLVVAVCLGSPHTDAKGGETTPNDPRSSRLHPRGPGSCIRLCIRAVSWHVLSCLVSMAYSMAAPWWPPRQSCYQVVLKLARRRAPRLHAVPAMALLKLLKQHKEQIVIQLVHERPSQPGKLDPATQPQTARPPQRDDARTRTRGTWRRHRPTTRPRAGPYPRTRVSRLHPVPRYGSSEGPQAIHHGRRKGRRQWKSEYE